MKYIHYWNQPEEPYKGFGKLWNPHRGNVRVGKQEIKWYNLLFIKKHH